MYGGIPKSSSLSHPNLEAIVDVEGVDAQTRENDDYDFELESLPYKHTDLEPYISEQVNLNIHKTFSPK